MVAFGQYKCPAETSRYLSVDKQDFVREAVKNAPMSTAAELIKNVQDSHTK